MPDEPEVRGLLALLLLTDARRATRADADGRLLLLEDQDRSRWDRAAIAEGTALVVGALRGALRRPARPVHAAGGHRGGARRGAELRRDGLAAAAAALRGAAEGLADARGRAEPRRGAGHGRRAGGGLAEIEADRARTAGWRATGTCPRPRPTCSAGSAGPAEAAQAYRLALDLTDNEAERAFLARRIAEVSSARRRRVTAALAGRCAGRSRTRVSTSARQRVSRRHAMDHNVPRLAASKQPGTRPEAPWPLLSVSGVAVQLRPAARAGRRRPRGPAGRARGPGRGERGGQDHAGALHRRGHRADQREIVLDGRPVMPPTRRRPAQGVGVVWQDLALCDNLDIAVEPAARPGAPPAAAVRHPLPHRRRAAAARLGIPLQDTTRSVRSLSGGQRQLVAVARAMARRPRLLLLDEPTASLGVRSRAQVEELIAGLRERGTTILLACHDIDQMFRLADRIVVLRHGRVVAEVDPAEVHPDDVVALVSGQQVDSSARRQLTRLHGLADRLVSADPSSSLSLILSALGAALGSERLCIHLRAGDALVCAASLGLPDALLVGLVPAARRPGGRPGRRGGRHRAGRDRGQRAGRAAWAPFSDLARAAKVASSWSVPVLGPAGCSGSSPCSARHRPAAARRAGPGHALRRLRGERHRAGPAARRGHRAQPGAGDDQGDAGDPGGPDAGGRRARRWRCRRCAGACRRPRWRW